MIVAENARSPRTHVDSTDRRRSDSQISRIAPSHRTVTPTNFDRVASDVSRAVKRVQSVSSYGCFCRHISHKVNSCNVETACNGILNVIP